MRSLAEGTWNLGLGERKNRKGRESNSEACGWINVSVLGVAAEGAGYGVNLSVDGSFVSLVLGDVSDLRDVRASGIKSALVGDRSVELQTDVVALDVSGGAGSRLSLRKHGEVNAVLKCVDYDFSSDECGSWVSTGIPFTDNGSHISFNVESFSAYAGAYLTVINVQSYPVVGGGWMVEFETVGTADLEITAVNGARWTNQPYECYDNKTEILTSEGWNYLHELQDDEKVATLDSDTKKLEWQKPKDRQVYYHEGVMYNLVLDGGGELLVSPRHRVYGKVVDEESQINPSFLRSSLVFNTSTLSCCFNNLSSDQIPHFDFNANAKYSESSRSGEISEPSSRNSFISGNENIFNCILTANNSALKSLPESPLFSETVSQYLPISSKIRSGESGVILSEKNSLCLLPLAIIKDITTLASTTMSILYTKPICLSCSNLPFFIFLPNAIANLSASSSDSLLLDEIASTNTLLNSADLFNSSSNILNLIASKATSDQSSGKALISFSSSFGILTINSGILTASNSNTDLGYLNNFSLMGISKIYENLTEDKVLVFLDENLSQVIVEKIGKVPYSGGIYDVDVSNDIVLVRRKEKAVWGGNSNTHVYDFSGKGNNSTAKSQGT